jgi:hypothetical protein
MLGALGRGAGGKPIGWGRPRPGPNLWKPTMDVLGRSWAKRPRAALGHGPALAGAAVVPANGHSGPTGWPMVADDLTPEDVIGAGRSPRQPVVVKASQTYTGERTCDPVSGSYEPTMETSSVCPFTTGVVGPRVKVPSSGATTVVRKDRQPGLPLAPLTNVRPARDPPAPSACSGWRAPSSATDCHSRHSGTSS